MRDTLLIRVNRIDLYFIIVIICSLCVIDLPSSQIQYSYTPVWFICYVMICHRDPEIQNAGDDKVGHYYDVIVSAMASQINSLTIVYSTAYSGAEQRKHQSSASLVVVRGIHRWPMNSPHKGPVTRKMFPFDDVIMFTAIASSNSSVNYQDGGYIVCDKVKTIS